MEKLKMLSGQELLDKGITKLEVTLPQSGLNKCVAPTDSFLEQKQIKAALDDRKTIIEAQRIEKYGVLSHAKWQDQLKLAEVTQQCGSHWKYVGHHKDKKLYLKPVEALYLMEVNCLLLTYNEIVVSLQQAYSMLLQDETSIYKYKVYASLSRLGYKVFEHIYTDNSESNRNITTEDINEVKMAVDGNDNTSNKTDSQNVNLNEINICKHNEPCDTKNKSDEIQDSNEKEIDECSSIKNDCVTINNKSNETESPPIKESPGVNGNDVSAGNISEPQVMTVDHRDQDMETLKDQNPSVSYRSFICNTTSSSGKDPLTIYHELKLKTLQSRKQNFGTHVALHDNLDSIPDFLNKQVVTINSPKEEYLPKNIFLNNMSYTLNINNVSSKNISSPRTDSRTYSISDEVNGDHIRRVTNSELAYRPPNVAISSFYQNVRQNLSYRQFTHWRPRAPMTFLNFNMFFQRNFIPTYNMPRFQFYPRTHLPMFPRYFNRSYYNQTTNNPFQNRIEELPVRKRKRSNLRKNHLEAIKKLASRLSNLYSSGNTQTHNIGALKKLIETYNVRYSTRLRLTDELLIENDEQIVDTIDLDEDDETRNKKRRIDKPKSLKIQDVHLNRIREISKMLKQLEHEGNASARHRRSFSNLIRTYNKSYNADIYTNHHYDILDKASIALDSSSESDSTPEKTSKPAYRKKLRNPFNILKRLSEKNQVTTIPATIAPVTSDEMDIDVQISENGLEKIFSKAWLPNTDDFGRPEIVKEDKMKMLLDDSKTDDFLLEFLKDKSQSFDNWPETKIAFLENIEETNTLLKDQAMDIDSVQIKSIIQSEDCTDMCTVLKKLSVIKTNKSASGDSELKVDFDVYKRDVQNFSKTNRPTPHFRIVHLNEASPFPAGSEIAALQSKYKDNVMMVFAVVNMDSISYLEINPFNLPTLTL